MTFDAKMVGWIYLPLSLGKYKKNPTNMTFDAMMVEFF